MEMASRFPAGDVARFTPAGAVTKDGTTLEPFDCVVAATGYAKTYSFLPPAERDALCLEPDGHWLFRNVLPPRVPVNILIVVIFSTWIHYDALLRCVVARHAIAWTPNFLNICRPQ